MAEPAPQDGPTAAPASTGVGLLFNASANVITSFSVMPDGQRMGPVPPLTLFPASQPAGSSTMAGCSFPIPVGGNFTLKIHFDTGRVVTGSVSTESTATPALYIVSFLNGFVAATPGGRAAALDFSLGTAADATLTTIRSRT